MIGKFSLRTEAGCPTLPVVGPTQKSVSSIYLVSYDRIDQPTVTFVCANLNYIGCTTHDNEEAAK
jgi:hypothetical protein